MPVLHVLSGLRCDAALTVVLLVECGVHMMDNHTEIALQGVVIDRCAGYVRRVTRDEIADAVG